MTDSDEGADAHADATGADEAGAEEASGSKRSTREKMGEGFKSGIGVLSAFKDALEETIQEARERGDLSTDRAREVMKEALEKAQAAGERARDRLDFAAQGDIETMRGTLDALKDRVGKLEERVFGTAAAPKAADEGSKDPTEADS